MRVLTVVLGFVVVIAVCVVVAHYTLAADGGPDEKRGGAPASQVNGSQAPPGAYGATAPQVDQDGTRRIAAEFLGCKPDDLKLATQQPKPKSYFWGNIEEVAWTGHCAVAGFPAADIEVTVDRVGAYVNGLSWRREGNAAPTKGGSIDITDDEAADIAFRVFHDCAKLPVERSSVRVLRHSSPPNDPCPSCEVGGIYPDGRRFGAMFWMLAQGRTPISYICGVAPPEPAATSPVRLTEDDARKAVEDKARARGDLTGIETKVRSLSTGTNYADRGVPVYQVELTAHIGKAATGRDEAMMPVFADIWAVNATTGEVITKPRDQARPEPNTAPPPPAK